jgi:hypothetical protein
MNKKTVLRFLGAALVTIVAGGICWQYFSETSAQKTQKPHRNSTATALASTPSDDDSLILLNAAEINAKSADAQAQRQDVGSFEGKRMHLIRFQAAIQPGWYKMLADSGVEVVDYIPNYTYLVYGDSSSIQRLQNSARSANSPIEWEGPYKAEYRISPETRVSKNGGASRELASGQFQVQLYKDADANAETLKLIDSLKTQPVKGQQEISHYVNLVVGLDEAGLQKLISQPDVISVHPYFEPVKLDERQDIILTGNLTGGGVPNPADYLGYLAGNGLNQAAFDASGFAVDLTDSGIDNANPASPNHFLLRKLGDPAGTSRFLYSRLVGTAHSGSTLQGCDGHGNLNSTIIGGYVPAGAPFNAFPHSDASGFRYGLGVAPFVKVGSSVIFDPDTFTSPNYGTLQTQAYADGARISSNSWGSSSNAYTTDSQSYDLLVRDAQSGTSGNQEMVIVFAAGNNGNAANTVASPSTGKNVITVGASENVQAFGGADQCDTTDGEADSANDIVGFSGRGPTSDQRKKPDIMLPGTHVSGGVGQATNVSPVSGNGAQNSCFTAEGVCAGPGTSNFWPLAQQWYTASSGTSHSTPAISGYAALIRQDFINKSLTPPSPAMTKALMMISARYMNGTGANDSLPSNNQGMGMANLSSYFDIFAQGHVFKDELPADKFTATGQQRVYTGTVASGAKPFHVTLAWTDKPGSTTGNAFVNNLDLEVTVGGNTYLGNVFTGANSVTGGAADTRNNVESVFVPAGVTGNFVIRVKATNIAGDGVPGDADVLDQDFALIVSDGTEAPVSVVQANNVVITAENGTPANNSPDPGETLTVNFDLQNVGTANSGTVTATLQNTGGVTGAGTPQNFGSLTAGGSAVTRPFTFTVSPSVPCGSQITLSFLVQDGASSFTFTKSYATGTPVISFSQNFDGVTAPALPAGWTTAVTGSGVAATTSATNPTSAPNDAFIPEQSTTGTSELVTPAIPIASASAQMTFKNLFNLENTFDGMVLEISNPAVNGGAYQDIVTAGGSFVSGGYTRAIVQTGTCTDPLDGRQAWSGLSAGTTAAPTYIDTVVNLPASAAGQSIKLKFLVGHDCSVTGTTTPGARIDNIQIIGGSSCALVNVTPRVRADFDGDGKTDFSVFRPSEGNWYLQRSTDGFAATNFGISTDTPTPGDYDNDGKTDIAIFRPDADVTHPDFWVILSSTSTLAGYSWGIAGDIPVNADYDGDGTTDPALFRPSNSAWYVRLSGGGNIITGFGIAGDVPVAGDFDGDGKADLTIFRSGTWIISQSSNGQQKTVSFGTAGDLPVPADYDADGTDDIAVFRPSNGTWYIVRSSSGILITPFGVSTDVPVPGDYDGDGKDDIAIYRNGDWWVNKSTGGISVANFGLASDKAIPKQYIP